MAGAAAALGVARPAALRLTCGGAFGPLRRILASAACPYESARGTRPKAMWPRGGPLPSSALAMITLITSLGAAPVLRRSYRLPNTCVRSTIRRGSGTSGWRCSAGAGPRTCSPGRDRIQHSVRHTCSFSLLCTRKWNCTFGAGLTMSEPLGATFKLLGVVFDTTLDMSDAVAQVMCETG